MDAYHIIVTYWVKLNPAPGVLGLFDPMDAPKPRPPHTVQAYSVKLKGLLSFVDVAAQAGRDADEWKKAPDSEKCMPREPHAKGLLEGHFSKDSITDSKAQSRKIP